MTSTAETGDDKLKLGKRLLRAQDAAGAAACFRQVIADDPDNVTAHEGLGTACFLARDWDAALAAFTTVTRLRPREARGFINLGAVHNRKKEYQKALDTLRRALTHDRSSADAYYNMGLAHRGLKQLALAVSAYRETLRLAPEMAEAHLNLANTYFDMKNYVQAKKEYEKAIALRPGFERAMRGLQHTQQILDEEKRKTGPFGRLVESSAKSSNVDDALIAMQNLTDEDRLLQRKQIQHVADVAESTARSLASRLHSELEKAVLSLNRAVTQSAGSPFVIQDALEEFRAKVADIIPLWQHLQEQTGQLQTLIKPDKS